MNASTTIVLEVIRRPFATAHLKLFALGVFVIAALALYYIDRLPSAASVDDRSWDVSYPRALVLFGLPASQVFEFTGAPGQGLDVRADTARLSPETIGQITVAGSPAPASKATSLTWLGRIDPAGKIELTIANARVDPEAGLAILPTGTRDMPQFRVTAVQTSLRLTLQGVAGGAGEMPPTLFKVADDAVRQPDASSMPVSFDLPPGESVLLTFPSAQAVTSASFRFGVPKEGELASHLPVQRFAIGRPATDGVHVLTGVENGVCSAVAGRFLIDRLRPLPKDCAKGGDLAVETLDVDAGKLDVGMSGSGFEIKDGGVVAAGLASAVINNKVVASLITLLCTALAAWVWRTMTGAEKS
ncbi:hypothetical protein DMC47_42960 [Nostoc sp. 3335mG]|nr:hypothetical protein DMC47_42960 [Nostoc sp. 3335mG]